MLQVQNGRFIFNWRRLDNGEYPRWSKTFKEFKHRYDQFIEYTKSKKLGNVEPDQWEVRYVNHLLQGEDWDRPADWSDLVPGVLGNTSIAAGNLESIDNHVQYVLPGNQARLHVHLRTAILNSDTEKELLTLMLTARGGVSDKQTELDGLNVGHEAIVHSFAELTGTTAHQRWGRQQ